MTTEQTKPRQCPVTRNGYECSRPEHGDQAHDFPIAAYVDPARMLSSLESAILNKPRNGLGTS